MRLAPRRWRDWALDDGLEQQVVGSVLVRTGAVEVLRLGQGEPIVLVPGLAGGWKLLMPLARRLARVHQVILVGLRGDRGLAAAAGAERPVDHAADLADALTGLGLERPAVFGVSYGGAVALELAVHDPNRLGALVIMGAEARFRGGLGATIARRVLERFPLPANNGFVNQFFNVLHGCRPEPGPLSRFVVERCWETDQGVMASRLRGLESFDLTDQLWRIEVPSLVLAGTRDVVVPAARQRALADSIAGARFASIEGAGHVGFLTHRDAVARHVERLVRRRSRLHHG
jgi:pimeloyl-ACP methyl ester carboxylesterase